MSHRLVRPFLALLGSGLLVLALGACGKSQDPQALLRETFSGTHRADSGKLTFDASLKGGQTPASIHLTGPFQRQGKGQVPKFQLAVSIVARGQTINAGATSTGGAAFLNFMGGDFAVPADRFAQFQQRYAQSTSSSAPSQKTIFSRLGVDPVKWLRDPQVVGDADVSGASTTHITAGVDLNALVDDLAKIFGRAGQLGLPNTGQLPQITPAQKSKLVSAVRNPTVDIFTGKDDKTLRRFVINLHLQLPGGQLGPNGADASILLELADLNKPQTVTAPANPRPLSDLSGSLGGLGGTLGGGGSGGGGASPSTPGGGGGGGSGAAPPNIQRYSRCIQQAGNDTAKRQQCVALLGGK